MEKNETVIKTKVLMIFILGFFLNLLWELLHSLLYDWDATPLINNIYVYIPRIVFGASFLDALWILAFIILNSIIHRSFQWVEAPTRRDYITLIIIGIITAIFIELEAIVFNHWSYNEFMPVILGIGLTPLIQLALTSIICLYTTSKIEWK